MKLGFAVPVSGSWATPSNQVQVARLAEQLGYSSLWTFQRLLYPAERGVKVRPQRAGLLSGSYADIAADIEAIAAQGMTELFIDLNFDPELGSIEADAAASMRRAEEVLREFAPGG